MKENSIEEEITRIKQRIEDVKEYIEYGLPYSEYLDLENSFNNILSDYKRALKENEELKQEKINNYKMIALAQNEALGYMQGYEDGKKLKTSAIASIVENQQYYIIKKQMEKYEEHIKKLQTENKEIKKIITEGITIKPYSPYKNYQLNFLRENFISVQKIKEKMKKDIKANEGIMFGGRRNGKTLEYGKRLGRIEMCQELLEGRK